MNGEHRSPSVPTASVQLALTGMTCAACAARIEKRLNRIEGAEASVNYATETAIVRYDPAVVEPGALIEAVTAIGYGAALPVPPARGGAGRFDAETVAGGDAPSPDDLRAEEHLRSLRQRLLVSTALGLPVVLLSMVPPFQFRNWQWLALSLAGPVVVWGAWPFHRAAAMNLRHGAATMDTLISLGTSAAFAYSLWSLFFGHAGMEGMTMSFSLRVERSSGGEHLYLEVACAVTVFLLAGRWFEARAKRRSSAALRSLLRLGAKEVALLGADGAERRVPIAQLSVGDRFVVRPGEKVATDGVVESGASAIDASLVTGESVPVEVGPGANVVGATVNVGGRLVVRATKVGADTVIAQIARLVTEAQTGKAPVQRLADRVSAVFVPVVVTVSIATLSFWLLRGESASMAFSAAVAVLVIACPCALGLATPTALLVGTGRGAQLGIIVRGLEVLESTRRVDTVVLDKTGTVTTGVMAVTGVHPAEGIDRRDLLAVVGKLEAASEHPVGRAIASEAGVRSSSSVDAFVSHAGRGVEGWIDGRLVLAGKKDLLAERRVTVDDALLAVADAAASTGSTAVFTAWDGRATGVVVVADAAKPTSAAAIARLRSMGMRPVLLTGDHRVAAHSVGATVGIDANDVIADVAPADKVDVVRRLQAEGRVVAMVGDGVNDAAALAQADLGIAMGTGTDVAMEASDLTVMSGDLHGVADAVQLARRTLAVIRGNLFWAFSYNVAAIPLAAAGMLNPVVAGAAMAGSSVFVVSNSLRLRRFRPVRSRD
jgi:Cu+-exporting ATPase